MKAILLNFNPILFVFNNLFLCEHIYIGAPVGVTMPDMDNGKARVILLE